MFCTGNHIGLPKTATENINFRSSLLLPQMNHIGYSFGCPRNYYFKTHRPGPVRSVLGSPETIVSGTPEIVADILFSGLNKLILKPFVSASVSVRRIWNQKREFSGPQMLFLK
jgi:hypothetical protein